MELVPQLVCCELLDSLAEAWDRSSCPFVSGCIIYFRAMKNKSMPKRNNTTARPCAPPFGTASK